MEQKEDDLAQSVAQLSLDDSAERDGSDGEGYTDVQEIEGEEHESQPPQEGDLLCRIDEALILEHIFGDFLDPYTVARLARTCKQFAHMTQDQSLWRSYCLRIWRDADKRVGRYRNDYRYMFIHRAHVRFDGFYVQENVRTRVVERDLYHPHPRVISTKFWRVIQFCPDGTLRFMLSNERPRKGVFLRHRAGDGGTIGNGQWRANSSEVIVKACLQHITLLLRLGLSETRIGSHNRLYWIEFAGKEFDAYGVLQRVQFPLPEDGFEFVKE